MTKTELTVRLQSIERINNSYYGNPRFHIFWSEIDGGRMGGSNTAADASFNYEVGNTGLRVGSVVRLTLNGRGTIDGMATV